MSADSLPERRSLNELALFAGAGGGILGGRLLGWRTVCAVEFASYPRRVLLQRQADGHLDRFPIWDDVRTFDGNPWRGSVDIVTGGFPCQDISSAGNGAGIDGARSGLWVEMARIIREVRPRFVLVENSPMLVSRGLGRVLGDLASMGFDARWGVLGAVDAGAHHERERIWVVANAKQDGWAQRGVNEQPDPLENEIRKESRRRHLTSVPAASRRPLSKPEEPAADMGWWSTEPGLDRVVDGMADRVDRLHAIGNGQVPAVVALAWHLMAPRAA